MEITDIISQTEVITSIKFVRVEEGPEDGEVWYETLFNGKYVHSTLSYDKEIAYQKYLDFCSQFKIAAQ